MPFELDSMHHEEVLVDKSRPVLKTSIAIIVLIAASVTLPSAFAQNPNYPQYGNQSFDPYQSQPNYGQQQRYGQTLRAQNGGVPQNTAGTNDQYRGAMPASGNPVQQTQYTQPGQFNPGGYPSTAQPGVVPAPQTNPNAGYGQGYAVPPLPPSANPGYPIDGRPLGGAPIYNPPLGPDAIVGPNPYYDPGRTADLTILAEEAQTGRFQLGLGINSDAGVTGSIVIDERNFDYRRYPTSFDDLWSGKAWRGAGQGFRIEALPGSEVQRYMVSFSEPYLFDTRVSLNLSGYLFNRIYRDWDEQRVGGRVGLGYRLTPDLSTSLSLRLENVGISDPRVAGVQQLDDAVGDHGVYSGTWSVTHDTRDLAFAPTEGHLFEASLEQVFGDFNYSRAEVDFRQYFLLSERPDGSGRHTLGMSARAGFSGSDTPIFENFFAGGFSTMRGFAFRRVGPITGDVYTGGPFRFLGSVEYLFPITADDMIKGVVFTDFGAVEESTKIVPEDFDIAPGVGLRISVPALGQAPIALDFAFPVNRADTDDTQTFSFFIGYAR